MPDADTTLQILGGGTPPQGTDSAAQNSDVRQASPTVAQPTSNSDTPAPSSTSNSNQDVQPVDDIQSKLDILAGKTRVDATAKQASSGAAPAAPKTGAPDLGALNAGANAATSMMTFGLDKPINSLGIGGIDYAADKVRGAVGAKQLHPGDTFGNFYDRAKARIEAQDNAAAEQHPIANAVGDVAGFAGSMGLAAPAAAGAATSAAAKVAPSAIKTALKSSAINGVLGGAIGGINALGEASGDTSDRLSAGAKGAEIGGTVGALVPTGVQAAGKVIGKVAGPIVDPLIARIFSNADDTTLAKLAQSLGRDDLTPADIRASLTNLGPEATIADAAGGNTQGLARSVVGMPGEAKEKVVNFLDQRQAGQGERVNTMAAKGLGVNQSYYDAEQALQNQKKNSGPLYQDAYAANPSISSPIINRILRTPVGQKALAGARELMQNDMALMAVPDPELTAQAKLVGQNIKGGIASGLKLRTLDYVKQGIDRQIGAAIRQEGGGPMVSALMSTKKAFVKALDEADSTATRDSSGKIIAQGKYSQARGIYAGAAQANDALEAGRQFITNDVELNNRNMAQMSPGEKEMFRVGAARAIRDKIYATPYGSDSVKNIFGSKQGLFGSAAKREKMQSLFPDQQSFNDFEKQMMSEAQMYATRAHVTQGSRTAPMQAEMEDAGIDAGHLLEAAHGNWKGVATKLGMNMLTKLQMPEPVRGLIADKLFTNDPVQNAATLKQLEAIMNQNSQKAALPPFTPSPAITGQLGNMSGAISTNRGSGQP